MGTLVLPDLTGVNQGDYIVLLSLPNKQVMSGLFTERLCELSASNVAYNVYRLLISNISFVKKEKVYFHYILRQNKQEKDT